MKLHIAFDLLDKPTGGGNQFLKALRAYLRSQGAYAESLSDATVVLVNGHQWGAYLLQIYCEKKLRPELTILHRIDGPMTVVRGSEENSSLDYAISCFNRYFADGTIFQSQWSRNLCIEHGIDPIKQYVVALNAPDTSIFYPPCPPKISGNKVRIISTSWSSNWRKGFDIFLYLDENLDFSRYEFTFIGNSPVSFRNIHQIPPIPSVSLAQELRNHDIFLQASHVEACSNSLIEAMNCGLVPVVRNNSSHPEIVGEAGVLYEGKDDVLAAIDVAARDRHILLTKLPVDITLEVAGRKYIKFASQVSLSSKAKLSLPALILTWTAWKMANRPRIFVKIKRLINLLVKCQGTR